MNNESETLPHSPNDPEQKPKRIPWIFRWFLRLFITISILLVILLGTIFVIGYYYQDDVKEYVIKQLNDQLNTEVIVDGKNIDFTVIKNFPYASVDFKNIKALDAMKSEHRDTLFSAGKISLQFNIIDIFNKNYHIKKIELSDADLKIRIDKDGSDNYHFWKESKDSVNSGFSFALEKIVLKNVHFSFKDHKQKQIIESQIKQSVLSGQFSEASYSLETVSDLFVERIKLDSTNYIRKKNIHAELELRVDNNLPSYKITNGKITIEDLLFEVFGNLIRANDESIINLGIKGKEMDIQSVLSLVPAKYKTDINDYESEGEIYFDATIQGSLANGNIPAIVADFGMKNASITQIKDNITLNNVNLSGHYSNGNKMKKEISIFELKRFSATINKGTLAGDFKMKDLKRPTYSGHLQVNTTLDELQRFIKVDTIETVNGQIKMDATFSSNGNNSENKAEEKFIASGDLFISDANIKLKNNSLLFSSINGEFKFDNNDLIVNSLTGKVSNSDFELKGFFRNMINYMIKEDQDINIEASLNSKNIDLNELLANKEEDSGKRSKYKLRFSDHINVNLNSEIDHLVFRKFNASTIRGVVKLKNKKLVIDPVTLSTMNGSITAGGMIDGTDTTKLLVTCFSDINKINVTKMFEQFENFGQTAITDKNIKGVATAKIQFASILNPALEMEMDKLYAGIDMSIDNGELNNVEAMKSLSRFIEVKELESVRFANLKNQIEIKNQVVNIPKMEIKSSAINITASGTHTFKNAINYRVKLSLNELLAKKARSAKKENEDFGEVADDGLGRTNIFLLMTGTVDDPIIKYDSKSAIQNVKQDLKVEKQNLRSILKDEFGLFKKDSTLNKKDAGKKEDETKFKINWEESDKPAANAGKGASKELKPPKKEADDDDF